VVGFVNGLPMVVTRVAAAWTNPLGHRNDVNDWTVPVRAAELV
jgi:hypothetical protein